MRIIVFLTIIVMVGFHSETNGADDLLVYVLVKDAYSNLPLEEATLEIRQNNSVYKTLKTNKHGKVDFNLPLDFGYHLYYSFKGYNSKYILIDTRNIPEEEKEGGFKLDLDVSLFHKRKGFDSELLEAPIGIGKYDPGQNSIEFDFDYTNVRMNLIGQEMIRVDSLHQDKFDKIVSKADRLVRGGKLDKAQKLYKKAFMLVPSNEKVLRKLKLMPENLNAPKV